MYSFNSNKKPLSIHVWRVVLKIHIRFNHVQFVGFAVNLLTRRLSFCCIPCWDIRFCSHICDNHWIHHVWIRLNNGIEHDSASILLQFHIINLQSITRMRHFSTEFNFGCFVINLCRCYFRYNRLLAFTWIGWSWLC